MQSNWMIAWRLLCTRKRAMILTLGAVALGVALFIMAQAQIQGIERFFIRTVLGANGAIRLGERFQETLHSSTEEENLLRIHDTREGKLYIQGIEDPEELKQALKRFPGIKGITEVMESDAQAVSGIYREAVDVQGILWESHLGVSGLEGQLVEGSMSQFKEAPTGVLLSAFLARRLGLRVGDKLELISTEASRPYRVMAIYETGVDQIDRKRLYIHLPEARILFHRPYGGVHFQITLDDPQNAKFLSTRLEDALGHHALSWEEREQVWLDVFWLMRLSSTALVLMVMLLAGIGMFNSLALLVLEKQKDLAILRAMGYSAKDVQHIFAFQGLIVYLIGTFCGFFLGAMGTHFLQCLPLRIRGIAWAGGSSQLHWDWEHYLIAALIVAVILFFASTLPARRAAKLEPGTIIRGSAL